LALNAPSSSSIVENCARGSRSKLVAMFKCFFAPLAQQDAEGCSS
jgi:hypothetical protein